MKIATNIFTIYLLALSFVPCGDGGGGIVEIVNHYMGLEHKHVSDHDQHSNDCGDDSCTVFCICSCCSSAVDSPAQQPSLVDLPTPIPSTNPSFSPNFIISDHKPLVWQPPKFS